MSLKIKALGRVTLTLTSGQALAVVSESQNTQIWLQNQPVNKAPTLSLAATGLAGTPLTYGPVSATTTVMVVAGNDDTYYEVGTLAVVKEYQNMGGFLPGSVNAVDATATLTVTQLLGGIITSSTAAAVAATLPTGTVMDAGSTWAIGEFYDVRVINTGGTNAWTLTAASGFTIVGAAAVAASTSGAFRLLKTAANTFVAYRIA